MTAAELAQLVQLIGARRFLFADTVPDLHPADRDEFRQLTQTDAFTRIAQMEDRLATDGRPGAEVPIDVGGWRSAYETASGELKRFEQRAESGLAERSRPAALLIVGRVIVAGLLGLVAVIITVVASVRIGRSLIRRLAGLRQAALELAVDRLPHVVSRLRRGEEVDVLHESPALPYSDDEIGQVGHAFNEVQRTAVNAAVEEAAVRRGLNEVFLNIARRSQTLLHRQLSILDGMEKRADDPEELEDLFRLDHLATRMRRHAEDLVILAGASPGRGWRSPVSVVDVVRGAVSEVEDYARVAIRPMPDVAVAGRAVGDVIHLLAELIENATSFSPPHTRVYVGAEIVAHGLAIEIEDRGLGLTLEAIAEANRRLANPPEFDPANSARLGLFVVARLAARHGVKVQLRPSAYGGVTAVALLPDALVVAGDAARPREAIAAMPAAAYLSAESNGSARAAREIVTAPRPAIAAPPEAAPQPANRPRHPAGRAITGRTVTDRARAGRVDPPYGAAPNPPARPAGVRRSARVSRTRRPAATHSSKQPRTSASRDTRTGLGDRHARRCRHEVAGADTVADDLVPGRHDEGAARRRGGHGPGLCRAGARSRRAERRGKGHAVTDPAMAADGLDWLLDDLVERVPAAKKAVVLSVDGLLMAASKALTQEDAEHLSAVAAGFQSLARGAGRYFNGGPVRQTIIEMESAFLFVTAAGQGACLAVLADGSSDIGLIAYEMAMLVKRVGQTLSTPSRPAAAPTDVG